MSGIQTAAVKTGFSNHVAKAEVNQNTKMTTNYPANTRRWNNVDLMLAQRRRRWANIKSTLFHRLVFAG